MTSLNHSPEHLTAVAAAVTIHTTSRQWLSFLRHRAHRFMNTKQTHKFNNGILVFGVAIVLFIYALSMRPAVAFASRSPGRMTTIRQVYFPIVWLHDYTPLARPIEAYVNNWE